MAFARLFGTVGDMSLAPTALERDAIDVVVFDAMGVLYSSADDVGEFLVPYLRDHGCVLDRGEIAQRYKECRLGTGVRLACLSNDVSEWSKLLRERFGLSEYITDWFISADIGVRKARSRSGLQALRFGTPRLSTTDQLRQELRPW
jgi:hypothetical protein